MNDKPKYERLPNEPYVRCDATTGPDTVPISALKRCKRRATHRDWVGFNVCTFHVSRAKGFDQWVGDTDERVKRW